MTASPTGEQLRLAAQRYDRLASLRLRRETVADLVERPRPFPGLLDPAVRELTAAAPSTLREVLARTSFPAAVELPAGLDLLRSLGGTAPAVGNVLPALSGYLAARLTELSDGRGDEEGWRQALSAAEAVGAAVSALAGTLQELRRERSPSPPVPAEPSAEASRCAELRLLSRRYDSLARRALTAGLDVASEYLVCPGALVPAVRSVCTAPRPELERPEVVDLVDRALTVGRELVARLDEVDAAGDPPPWGQLLAEAGEVEELLVEVHLALRGAEPSRRRARRVATVSGGGELT